MSPQAWLHELGKGDAIKSSHALQKMVCSVGTDRHSDIRIKGRGVGAVHAQLRVQRSGITIEAVAGERLVINGRRTDSQELRHNDVIDIGSVRLRFEMRVQTRRVSGATPSPATSQRMRSTLDAFTKLTRANRSTADLAQHPRYLLLQQVHYATVRRLLTAPPRPREEAQLWEARGAVLASTGGVPQLPKDALALLEKHTAPGLRATYQKRLFGPKKENLRKIKKELIKLVPQAEARMPATPPPMPEQLPQELIPVL